MTAQLASLPEGIRAELLQGMRVPQPTTLAVGTTLMRFVNSTTWADRWTRSPWWMRDIDYRRIEAAHNHSLEAHGNDQARAMTLGLIAKQALAVRQQWFKGAAPNLMDMVITAVTVQELPCFIGRGHTQYETAPNGFRVTWTGWSTVQQIFIPALAEGRGPNIGPWLPENRSLVRVIRTTRVLSQQLF